MTIPTLVDTVNCTPDAEGYVFDETWADPACPKWDRDLAGRVFPTLDVRADDGLMGSRFVRLSNALNDTPTAKTYFDHTKPIQMDWLARIEVDANNFVGLGVLYCGENAYDGVTYQNGIGRPGLGLYDLPIVPGTGSGVGAGQVWHIEQEWDPTTWTLRARANGGAWTTRQNTAKDASHPAAAAALLYPATVWMGLINCVSNIGRMRVKGTPMWGTQDAMGWLRWQRNNATYFGNGDGAGVLGGLTGRTTDSNPTMFYIGAHPNAVTSDFDAQSPIIGIPAGYAYKDLTFRVYNATPSNLQLRVRDAATGNLLPDSIVTANAAGLHGRSQMDPVTAQVPTGLYRVDLRRVPSGTQIYLDLTGHVDSSVGEATNAPRLGGAWVSFRPASSGGVSVMPATAVPYNNARLLLMKAGLDLQTSLKAALVDSTYTPDLNNHKFLSDVTGEISGNGYARQSLTTVSVTVSGGKAMLMSDPVKFVASGGPITARRMVLYKDTGTASTSPLICAAVLDNSPADVTATDGQKLTISPDPTNGWVFV